MSPKIALVIRATGSQGKATTIHLLKNGWVVHALVRDPEHERALALKALGAELHKGDLSDSSTVEAALSSCSAAFLNQMPNFTDPNGETKEAAAFLDAAKKAGIQHVVHTTTLPLNDPNIKEKLGNSIVAPAVLDKGKVEKLVQASGISYTIIRPGYFMTNLIAPFASYGFPDLASGKFLVSYNPDTVLPLVDPNDVGALAAAVFENPSRFSGKILGLAGENVGIPDIANQLSEFAGKSLEVVYRTKEETANESATNPMIAGQTMCIGLDSLWDEKEVKGYGIPVTTFREFLESNRDAIMIDAKISYGT
jgi:uncharacterized protein YbjT (DUF2867 family)